ncbi:gamma-aminobutyric acid receptor subunit beta-1 [Hyalella azteca]|uniref:Gamma-aminobutyric acid receptor subunit beta-1 n=1 Tax=Hyalella azteca TaxID=294128 RepID=A0A979FSS3_HYAAZ|nr:gamma-aminobutyric acid receptor subunit beta-1 [Hyalella azteca]
MLSDFNSVERASLFNRGSGLLVNTQHVNGKFACVFDVFRYPFDVHRCELLVRLGFSSERLVTFTNDSLSLIYTGANKLKEFNVQNMTAIASSVNFRNSSNTELKVTIILERIPGMVMMNILLPSFMLSIIGYSTLYIRLELLQVRLPVALTTMLVLYTLFNQVSTTLPTTAYIKMIDIWFLTIISLIFVMSITHVVVDWMKFRAFKDNVAKVSVRLNTKVELETNAEKGLRITRCAIVPLIFLSLNVGFWAAFFL